MSRTEIDVAAPPETVFEMLADGERYSQWVVGAKAVRSVDPDWPRPHSRFRHTLGVGPIEIRDSTEVLEVEPHRRLVLLARARPAGVARVEIEVEPTARGSHVTIVEHPVRGPAAWMHNPVMDRLLHLRNRRALRRLRHLVEQQPPPPDRA